MVTFPIAEGARMLGIHPKTLHHWLTKATIPLVSHPLDARIKCVTLEHLQHLARIYGRPVPSFPTAHSGTAEELALHPSGNEADPLQIAHEVPVPVPVPHEAALLQKLSCLETRMVTLQEQLAQLALALLQERERAVERRLSTLETVIAEMVGSTGSSASGSDAHGTDGGGERAAASPSRRPLNPAEQRARSRMPSLIEYGASGSYVILSSQEGELSLVPDSRDWFEWLATLSSFRFVGQSGRFTAYRASDRQGPKRTWTAHRGIHHHHYKYYLGTTDHLTLDCLEHMAAQLQSHLVSL